MSRLILNVNFVVLLGLGCVALETRADAATVAYWRFEEGAGSTASDSSGFGNTGIINQGNLQNSDVPVSLVPATGELNNFSLQLNGSGQFVIAADSPSLRPENAITIEAYVKLAGNVIGNAAIVGRQLSNTHADSFNLGLRGHAGVVGFNYPFVSLQLGAASVNVDIDTPLSVGQWYHLAGTWDGSQLKMYLDGNLEGAIAATGTISYPQSNPVVLGADNEASGNLEWFFPGRIDEVRISDAALSPNQFLSSPVPEPSTLGLLTVGCLAILAGGMRRRFA